MTIPTYTTKSESTVDLEKEYTAFCNANSYPLMSADEVLHEILHELEEIDAQVKLKRIHLDYLKTFIERWETAQEREDDEFLASQSS